MANQSEKFLIFAALVGSVAVVSVASAQAAEKYSATIEDGTPKMIAASTNAEESNPEIVTEEKIISRVTRVPKPAPTKVKVTPVREESELTALKRENAELSRRMKALEEAKQQNRDAQVVAVEDDAPEASNASDEHEKASPAETAENESVEAPATTMPTREIVKADAPSSEDEDGEEVVSDAANEEAAAPAPKAVVVKKAPAREKVAKKARTAPVSRLDENREEVAATVPQVKKTAKKFDVVPNKHVGEIAQRLKYANEILKRYGRAYDYRVTTLKEFKKALADLEASEEKSKALN